MQQNNVHAMDGWQHFGLIYDTLTFFQLQVYGEDYLTHLTTSKEQTSLKIAEYSMTFDRDVVEHRRVAYTFLDFIADLGGLFIGLGFFGYLFTDLIVICGNTGFKTHMISQIFRKKPLLHKDNVIFDSGHAQPVEVPKCHLCCFKNPKQKIIDEATHRYEKELDVAGFVTKQKILWSALKKQFPTSKIKKLRQGKHLTIDSSDPEYSSNSDDLFDIPSLATDYSKQKAYDDTFSDEDEPKSHAHQYARRALAASDKKRRGLG